MVELQNFGWNLHTFSFLGTTLFALLGAWGLKDQIKGIWGKQSAEAVSAMWFIIFAGMFSSFLVYGVEEDRLALILQGITRVPLIAIVLIGVGKFQGFTRKERLALLAMLVAVGYQTVSEHKEIVFLGLSYLGIASSTLQPWKIWKAKTVGVVSIRLLVVYNFSVVFWTIYGVVFKDTPIILMAVPYVIVYSTTIALWLRFRKH